MASLDNVNARPVWANDTVSKRIKGEGESHLWWSECKWPPLALTFEYLVPSGRNCLRRRRCGLAGDVIGGRL